MSMRFLNSIFSVDSHTAGHTTRVVVGGLPKMGVFSNVAAEFYFYNVYRGLVDLSALGLHDT